MKKIIITIVLCFAFVGNVYAIQKITRHNVQNPNALEKLENAQDDEADANRTLSNELRTDHGTFRTVINDLKTLLNNIRTWTQAYPTANPSLGINSNFDAKNDSAFDFVISGDLYTEAADTNFDTGTAATFPAGTWGIALLSVDTSGTTTATWATASGVGYASEALAIAALPATPTGECAAGYVTVRAHASFLWLAGTDALAGGSGGTPAQTTNYYDKADAQSVISAAVSSSPPAAVSAAAVVEQVEGGK